MRTAVTFVRAFHGRAVFIRSRVLAAGSALVALLFRSAANVHLRRAVLARFCQRTSSVARSFALRFARGSVRAAVASPILPHVKRRAGGSLAASVSPLEVIHLKRRAASTCSLNLKSAFAGINVSSKRKTSSADRRVTSTGDVRITSQRS